MRSSPPALALLLLIGLPRLTFGQNVSVELSLERTEYRQGTAVPVKYTVTNRESRPVAVLKWNTPLDGLTGDPFIVLHDGSERRFSGVMVLRADPIASDWVVIPPNGSVNATVDLAPAYDLTAAGNYEIRQRHGFQHIAFDRIPRIKLKALRRRDVRSNTVTFRMLDGAPPPPDTVSAKSGSPTAISSFVGCSGDQQSSLNNAFGAMVPEASTVSSAVAGWSCTSWAQSSAAQTFLGACTATGLANAQRITSTITNRAAGSVILDCTATNTCAGSDSACQKTNVIAFTCLGGGNSTIYACPALFFGYPQVNALDSQETILYHELSHWAYTRDYAYGCQNCVDLAKNNPAEAQNNASSYMYFAIFQANGGTPSCGVEHLAALAGLLVLLVQVTGRKVLRTKTMVRLHDTR
jgi:peptidyl-Lys metalloendopeptidase